MSGQRLGEVRQALARRALDRREQFGATMAWFCMERLVCRMSGHGHRDKFLLGGDLLLFAICGGEAPYEWEAELRCRPEEFQAVDGAMAAVCEVTLDDGLVFELTAKDEPAADLVALSIVARLGPNPCPLTILVRPEVPFAAPPTDLPFASALGSLSASRPMGRPACDLMAELVVDMIDQGVSCRPKVLSDAFRLLRQTGIDFGRMPQAISARLAAAGWSVPEAPPPALDRLFASDASVLKGWETYLNRSRTVTVDLAVVTDALRGSIWPWIRESAAKD